ncbi:26S proteasome non-ATPase regulatory subunit [Coelomomyces lativittatus]|nr:26S proteasome non-ATPase regulatory subunit [Coelomomyces lativittatus]KAJ1507416.1 26S proteasome non-ATPase regulatory subunit [Coelomomyces lativittatus]KAJ1514875.1 26S proteasome non-ATPase regulatory subunit [Coelomomyces lativittatus]
MPTTTTPTTTNVVQNTSFTSETPMEVDGSEDVKLNEKNLRFFADVKYYVSLLDRAVLSLENRFITRVLRMTSSLRPLLTIDRLVKAILNNVSFNHTLRNVILKSLDADQSLPQSDEVDMVDSETKSKSKHLSTLPEVGVYFGLLALLYFHDQKLIQKGMATAAEMVQYIQAADRRTLDPLSAKVYFYYSRFHSLTDQSPKVRAHLLVLHRTATLRQDDESTATLINLLLQNYLDQNLVGQAEKLVSKSSFPELASHPQTARYYYYLGRIKAIHLDYTSSHKYLQQAIRKAPQTKATQGFLQAAQKLLMIVQLLMGEIPDRALFRQRTWMHYKHLVMAVRKGDLQFFQTTLAQATPQFTRDRTFNLIVRLRHNVIKTGIRLLSLSYSCISLRDVCLKLALESEEDAEYMVAKAIRDGVIDAVIDHVQGYVKSKDGTDIYATQDPLLTFHQRITFCLTLHNESVRAMRYPNQVHRKNFTDSEEVRELEKEIQHHLENEDENEDF